MEARAAMQQQVPGQMATGTGGGMAGAMQAGEQMDPMQQQMGGMGAMGMPMGGMGGGMGGVPSYEYPPMR